MYGIPAIQAGPYNTGGGWNRKFMSFKIAAVKMEAVFLGFLGLAECVVQSDSRGLIFEPRDIDQGKTTATTQGLEQAPCGKNHSEKIPSSFKNLTLSPPGVL